MNCHSVLCLICYILEYLHESSFLKYSLIHIILPKFQKSALDLDNIFWQLKQTVDTHRETLAFTGAPVHEVNVSSVFSILVAVFVSSSSCEIKTWL